MMTSTAAERNLAMSSDAPLWAPEAPRRAAARLTHFARYARTYSAPDVLAPDGTLDYGALHAWSVAEPEPFWSAVWRFCGVVATRSPTPDRPGAGVGLDRMAPPDPELGPRWFPEARLNFGENLLQRADDHLALISWDETGRRRTLSYAELRREVACFAAGLRAHGVRAGDRVAGFLPNAPETVVALLAAASIGAVWSSCSPDFGTEAVVERFGQIAPRVLIAADGYRYAGKRIDRLPRVRELADAYRRWRG